MLKGFQQVVRKECVKEKGRKERCKKGTELQQRTTMYSDFKGKAIGELNQWLVLDFRWDTTCVLLDC